MHKFETAMGINYSHLQMKEEYMPLDLLIDLKDNTLDDIKVRRLKKGILIGFTVGVSKCQYGGRRRIQRYHGLPF